MSEHRPRPAPSFGASLLTLVGTIGAWWAVAQIRVAGRPLVATPAATMGALSGAAPTLAGDLAATAARSGVGLAAGIVAGLAIGALAAVLVRRAPVIEGLLDLARSVPPVLILPVCLLAFGYNEVARVATVASGCVWTISLAVITAASSPRSVRREMLDVAGAAPLQALAWTQPWESLGIFVVGLRTCASTAVVVAVVTEMIAGAERGLGSRVIAAQIVGDTGGLTLDVLAAGVLGYGVNLGLRWLERWVRRLET
jgi:ABC-type nitrate/sulfonate/bicarbonate transport system permease component